jgi:hypothetical protein
VSDATVDNLRPPLAAHLLAAASPMRALLGTADPIGHVFRFVDFREAHVVTNDSFLYPAHGVPEHCFLIACSAALAEPGSAGSVDPDDEEVILLRVEGSTGLPDESDRHRLRARAAFDVLTGAKQSPPRERAEVVDQLTASVMQTFALRCRVLGTFYDEQIDGRPALLFGADVDGLYGSSHYFVYKPYGPSLELIVNHLRIAAGEQALVEIGTIRYSSTRRRELKAAADGKPTNVPVKVDIVDFIGRKSALFGMTRLGKSNALKTICAHVAEYGYLHEVPIGQLIFDPAGEYANINVQDQTALAQLGDTLVKRYRYGATEAELAANSDLATLALNFYAADQLEAVWAMCQTVAQQDTNVPGFLKAFVDSDPVGVNDEAEDVGETHGNRIKTSRVRFLFYAMLLKLELQPPPGYRLYAPMSKPLRQELAGLDGRVQFLADDAQLTSDGKIPKGGGAVLLSPPEALVVAEVIAENAQSDTPGAQVAQWWAGTPRINAIGVMVAPHGHRGFKALLDVKAFHSSHAGDDYAVKIYDDLVAGRIVIVDLSKGTERVLQFASERVIRHVLARQAALFSAGEQPHKIQICLEEAHRLFARDKFQQSTSTDPYVTMAREAAKFNLGMIFATQEPAAVDESVLNQTSNWIVAHLNDDAQVKRIEGRYEFKRFKDQILSAEDPGFVRLKTASSRYVLPVQIHRFDHAMINRVRASAGLEPIHLDDTLEEPAFIDGVVAVEPPE